MITLEMKAASIRGMQTPLTWPVGPSRVAQQV
jgi:hypothetical protein